MRNEKKTQNSRGGLRFGISALSIALASMASATVVASPLFSLSPSSSHWVSRQEAGAEAAFVLKGKTSSGFQPNINVIRDPSHKVYLDLDAYMSDAFKLLVESGTHRIRSVNKRKSAHAGEYYLVRSGTDGRELLQGVFFRPGLGAFIVTAVSSQQDFDKLESDFISAIESARF